MKSMNLRVRDEQNWEDFKLLARQRNMSVNGLLNQMIQQFVARHSLRAKSAPPADL